MLIKKEIISPFFFVHSIFRSVRGNILFGFVLQAKQHSWLDIIGTPKILVEKNKLKIILFLLGSVIYYLYLCNEVKQLNIINMETINIRIEFSPITNKEQTTTLLKEYTLNGGGGSQEVIYGSGGIGGSQEVIYGKYVGKNDLGFFIIEDYFSENTIEINSRYVSKIRNVKLIHVRFLHRSFPTGVRNMFYIFNPLYDVNFIAENEKDYSLYNKGTYSQYVNGSYPKKLELVRIKTIDE